MTTPVVRIDARISDLVRTTGYVVYDGDGDYWREEKSERIPEKYMSKVKEVVGDGLARVAIGLDAKTSIDFGNAAGGHATVSLTCGQDEESITTAVELAAEIAAEATTVVQQRAQEILMRARNALDGIVVVDEEHPAEKALPAQARVAPGKPTPVKEFRVAPKIPPKIVPRTPAKALVSPPVTPKKVTTAPAIGTPVVASGSSARAPAVMRLGDASKKPSFKKQ